MKRQLLLLFILLFVTKVSLAQNQIEWPKFKGKDTFSAYMQSMLNIDRRITDSECAQFMVAIKFVVDKNGFVDSVAFSAGTKPLLKLLLKQSLETTHGTWQSMTIAQDTIISYPMILPIYFSLESTCSQGTYPENRMLKTLPQLLGFDPNNQSDDLKNVMLFDPIYVYSARGFEDIGGNPKKKN